MKYFDLHCDTMNRILEDNTKFNTAIYNINLRDSRKFARYTQCFAMWMSDAIKQGKALDILKKYIEIFNTQIKTNETENFTAILTVEDLGFVEDLETLDYLKENSVQMASLCWNGENNIGGGVGSDKALSDFGKEVVRHMENLDITIDLSHASDSLFFDVAEKTTKALAASHSNSRTICEHKRNLTDEQFNIIKDSGGIVGINFSSKFLNNEADEASANDVLRHADYLLSLGGEDTVCMGSDFDGTSIPYDINSLGKVEYLYELFLKHNYSETIINKVFFENAQVFFANKN